MINYMELHFMFIFLLFFGFWCIILVTYSGIDSILSYRRFDSQLTKELSCCVIPWSIVAFTGRWLEPSSVIYTPCVTQQLMHAFHSSCSKAWIYCIKGHVYRTFVYIFIIDLNIIKIVLFVYFNLNTRNWH